MPIATEGRIPAIVLDAVNRAATIEWGLHWHVSEELYGVRIRVEMRWPYEKAWDDMWVSWEPLTRRGALTLEGLTQQLVSNARRVVAMYRSGRECAQHGSHSGS